MIIFQAGFYDLSYFFKNFFSPTTNAIMGLTFASYLVKPLFPYCNIPDPAIRLIAAAAICMYIFPVLMIK